MNRCGQYHCFGCNEVACDRALNASLAARKLAIAADSRSGRQRQSLCKGGGLRPSAWDFSCFGPHITASTETNKSREGE
jgi:hypothetical protein